MMPHFIDPIYRYRRYYQIGIYLVLSLFHTTLQAAGNDLISIYREALNQDPNYASARAALAVGLEKEKQGFGGLLPTVLLTANTAVTDANVTFRKPTTLTQGPRTYNNSGYTLSLTQPLFRWSNWKTWSQSEWQAAQANSAWAQATQDLLARVVQAYFDILTAQSNLQVTEAQKLAIASQLEQAKKNFEVGNATIVDVNDAQSRHDLSEAGRISAENDLALRRTQLQQITGKITPNNLLFLREPVSLSLLQLENMSFWVEAAETNNYGVKIQEASLKIAKIAVDINLATAFYPSLDLSIQRSVTGNTGNNQNNIGTDVSQTLIGVQLTVPLYSGLAFPRLRESEALLAKGQADLDVARRLAAQNARQYYLAVTNGLAQVKAYEAAVRSSETALESNRLGYDVGVRINIDVLNAQQQLYQTRSSLMRARHDTLVNSIRLKAAVGALSEIDILAINQMLQE